VQPNASQNEVSGFRNNVLYVRVAAPPTKGRANEELAKFLSGLFGVRKRDITIEKGLTSKNKIVAVEGPQQEQVLKSLEKYRPNQRRPG
jgi:uncharacterized protein (TIGR00251 family)